MSNLPPHWAKLLKSAGWYVATLIVLIGLLTVTRLPFILIVLWLVGLVWGAVLAYQLSQRIFGQTSFSLGGERLEGYLEEAQTYRRQIQDAISQASNEGSKIHLERVSHQVDTWTTAIDTLAHRIGDIRQNEIIHRDLKQVPQAIKELTQRLSEESDPTLQKQLERTLANRQKQLEALESLQHSVERADLQIENTLSMLGTIYSQILTGQSTRDASSYRHLSEEIEEEVERLQD
ncbi:MAG: primosomal replication protein PriC, partial [Chloroflexota bacterium]